MAGELDPRADRHRPRYHFTAPTGWLNDPNGVSQWDGVFHLFYQWNPHAPVHHYLHWGHATSTDLVHWTHEPVALAPSPGADEDGCWSGVLVDDGGVPTLVYSGHRDGELETCCVATGSADLRTWTKHPANPVISAPEGMDLTIFRDHCVWREGGAWRQVIGSGAAGHGLALLFESEDLRRWTYLGPLASGEAVTLGGPPTAPDWIGSSWECPDFFGLDADGGTSAPGAGDIDVLVFSAWDRDPFHTLSFTGTYRDSTFTPTAVHRVDLGDRTFYAPQSFRDDAGRRVMFGWLQEERAEESSIEAGWSGAMSLPRHVTLAGGVPYYAPVDEVASLRRDQHGIVPTGAPAAVPAGGALAGPTGDQLDLEIDLLLPVGGAAELTLCATPDGAEATVLELGRRDEGGATVDVRLDRSRSSADERTRRSDRQGSVPVGDDGRVRVRVLVDHSALEIFCNGQPLSARIYPTRDDALGTRLSVPDGGPDVVVERFDAWTMAPRAG